MKSLRILSFILVLCLLTGCAFLPETETEKKVYAYAKENGLSYRDYPKSLIALLERNPETEKFVLEYPIAKDAVPVIDLEDQLNTDTVPLFLQWDQRWGYLQYGSDVAGLTACGPVSLSMAAVYLSGDAKYSPDEMIRFAIENNYYVSGSGSSWTLISEGGVKLGFDVTELPLDKNRIRKNLEVGNPIVFVVGPGFFTTTGHFMVMTGWEDGKIRINDPNSIANSQQLWTYEEIKDQIRNLWAIRN